MTADRPARPNRLIHEKSPYLLQHAHNPVDWYPWGSEAFAKATQEDKPILLSIGYSTCYWCHVMEQESFENSAVAKVINDSVVPIKVDREERPDLDALYMTAAQAMGAQGGWPLNVFLTPDGQPFFGGTYFPPEDRGGRPGLTTVLASISQAWNTRRAEVLRSSQEITRAIQAHAPPASAGSLTAETLTAAARQFASTYDSAHGGFGEAPKFPRPHALSLLLRVWDRARESHLLEMVEATLDAMARGGIHDQLGGGFHRYSTDARWLAPHFEKMLYDQALLARSYLEAYQITRQPRYAEVARDTFEYVLRDLPDARGAFYSAEDAGEVGKEGEFYLWTPKEIASVLGSDEAARVSRAYDVTPQGNFSAHAEETRSGEGRSILHLQHPGAVIEQFASARAKLLEARQRRPRPHRDDKVLTDWNGLMIGALAYGARALDEPRYAQAASAAAAFVLERLQRDGQLLHRYRDGVADIPAFLDDYAFLSWGLLELYETTFDVRWLEAAARLTSEMLPLFWDEQGGGFFLSGRRNEPLIAKTKELYDGAVPSGNSVAALVLVRVGQLTMNETFQRRAEQLFKIFSESANQAPHAFPQFLIAADAWLGPMQEIVIAGDPDSPGTRAMVRAVHERFLPRAVTILHPVNPSAAAAIERLVPFIKVQQLLHGQPTAYVCRNYVCNLPTTDIHALTALLEPPKDATSNR